MDDRQLLALSEQTGAALRAAGATLTTAESCTGGWIAKIVTDVAGSSAWFQRGFVTYSNAAKSAMVGVQPATLAQHGAVSEAVVREMAQGARDAADADYAVSVSGIAGPDGGSADKPVGTVWFAFAHRAGATLALCQHFSGDREAVRRQATAFALQSLVDHFLKKST
ncbi:nicotinamide-nucleotide amidase [Pantoea sp. 1.19]|uniref:nicotinamide-nucleotide amidase n=1 Tax=Pantoea sp. 1.19 TaxID=1925589 RepID=UPI0009491BFA|nr:nicotinamide-nucleotide amidase [Pantoea sp. 1.19]